MKDRRREFECEEGYILLAVIFMTLLVLVALAVAAPKIAMSIQRDKELETIHRGQQYKRAIKLYYQKFGTYPTSIDQLVETNQIRFLRKKYTDPLTGKDDWKPVLFGQAHVRPLGFFGQPLVASAALSGSAGSMYAVTTTTTTDANGVPIASPDSTGAAGAAGGLMGSASSGTGSNGISSMFAQSTPGMGAGSSNSPLGSTGAGTGTGTGTGSSSGSGPTIGGGPIVGFTLPVDKPSLIDYKLQTRYNKWEFNYDPTEEQSQALSGLAGGANAPNPASTTGLSPGMTSPGTLPTNPAANPAAPPGNSGPSGSPPDGGSTPQPQ